MRPFDSNRSCYFRRRGGADDMNTTVPVALEKLPFCTLGRMRSVQQFLEATFSHNFNLAGFNRRCLGFVFLPQKDASNS
jgi:hypothetical protein